MAKIKHCQYKVKILKRTWCYCSSHPWLVKVWTDTLVLKSFHFLLKWTYTYHWRKKWQLSPVVLLNNSMERGAQQTTVHGVTKELHKTEWPNTHTHTHTHPLLPRNSTPWNKPNRNAYKSAPRDVTERLSDKYSHWKTNQKYCFPCALQLVFLSYWYEKQLTIIWQHKSPIKISFSIYNWLWYLHIFYLVSSCLQWWFLTYFSPSARIRIQES